MKLKVLMQATIVSLAAVFLVTGCTKPKPEEAVVVTDGGSSSSTDTSASSGLNSSSFSPETIYFGFDESNLSGSSQGKLALLATYLQANTSAAVEIEGHCDERGSTEYNVALGMRRAQSVADYLINSGVNPSQINPVSYGEERPAVEGHNESSWTQNRRAEFVLTTP